MYVCMYVSCVHAHARTHAHTHTHKNTHTHTHTHTQPFIQQEQVEETQEGVEGQEDKNVARCLNLLVYAALNF
jgi:hypothetical protein